jgi:simple sugar transport system ATP-binding protein
LVDQRERCTAILIVSEDLDEIGAHCDRILVMHKGSIVGEADAKTTSRETLGLMMAGLRQDDRQVVSSAAIETTGGTSAVPEITEGPSAAG